MSLVMCMSCFGGTTFAKQVERLSSNSDFTVNTLQSKISDKLSKMLEASGGDELIPVSIELLDSLNNDNIEQLAYQRANIAEEELIKLEESTPNLSDTENSEFQQDLLKKYDRVSEERNKILIDYYLKNNNDFISKAGIDKHMLKVSVCLHLQYTKCY
jgi:hypothetical protein